MAQQDEPKPVLSKDPLTAEQVQIYRAFLAGYTHKEETDLNIANTTMPFSSAYYDNTCLKGFSVPKTSAPVTIHQITEAVALNARMHVVDPAQQGKKVKENDPGELLRQRAEEHQPVQENEIEAGVKKAFAAGLFTFSEILMNKQHTRAVLQYSFVCGRLCGHGNTVIFRKVAGKWEFAQQCGGGWIS